jgi:hypothetical protein
MKETSIDISSNFIRKLLSDKIHAKRVAMSRISGLYPYIVAGHSSEEIEERERAFFEKLHSYPEDQIESLMQQLLDELITKYSKPINKQDLSYVYEHELDKIGGGIQFVRYLAGKQKRQPLDYHQLEIKVLSIYKRKISPLINRQQDASQEIASLVDRMITSLSVLPRVELVPSIPLDFKVEDLLP